MMIKKRIEELKKKLNALVIAHNYQPPGIQELGDFCGDSLELSRKAAGSRAEVIVFCGVDFMAQTAKILAPDRKVILPAGDATCPMAEMITPGELSEFKNDNPGAAVVTYVNSTADVKALSDVCCTSSNALKIVNSLSAERVIFTPDRNLAHYVSLHTEKEIIPWHGFCPVHENITVDEVASSREKYPDAAFMAHPECRPEVLELADHIVSTGQMFEVAQKDPRKIFLLGTETGMVYPLKKRIPGKEFIPVSSEAVCPNMKKITPRILLDSLESLSPEVTVPEKYAVPAREALEKMLRTG